MSGTFDVAASPASIAAAARIHALDRKERGSFSFLTWPFFIAQALALEPLIAGAAKPAVADEDSVSQTPAPEAAQNEDPPIAVTASELKGGDEEGPVPTSTALAGNLEISLPIVGPEFEPAPRGLPLVDTDAGTGVSPLTVSGGGSSSGMGSAIRNSGSGASSHGEVIVHLVVPAAPGHDVGPDTVPIPGTGLTVPSVIGMDHGQSTPGASESLLPEIISHSGDGLGGVGLVVATPVSTVVDLLSPLLDTAAPAIDGALLPLGPVLDAVPADLHAAGNALGALVEGVVAPAAIVETSLHSAAGSAVNAVEHVLTPAPTELAPIVGGALDLPSSTPILVSTAQIVADGFGSGASMLGKDGLMASGGTISFGGEPALDLPMLDPFVDGRYTEYGLAIAQAPRPELALMSLSEGEHDALTDSHQPAPADAATDSSSHSEVHAPISPEPSTVLDEVALRLHDSVL